jgi:hypothetical protein
MLSVHTLKQLSCLCVSTAQGETCLYRHSLVAKHSEQACVFWASSACRAGAACPFIHNGVDFTAVVGAAQLATTEAYATSLSAARVQKVLHALFSTLAAAQKQALLQALLCASLQLRDH